MTVGVDAVRTDGRQKVTGAATYAADIVLPGMLHAKLLRSSMPHARLLRVDTSRAAEELGVWTLTRDDLSGIDPYYGIVVKDQPIVAIDRVLFAGDVVAAVAAEDRSTAEAALDLIAVEYEPLPVVTELSTALAPNAPVLHEKRRAPHVVTYPEMRKVHQDVASNICSTYKVEQGDVATALTEADEVFEDVYTVPMIQHGHIEPHAAIASWDPAGKLTVYSSTQNPSVIRTQLAGVFGLPESFVRVIVPYVGGGFGAKLYPKLEPVAALLARKAGRPVSLVITRDEVFMTSVRHPAEVRITSGVMRDGTLTVRRVEAAYDTGAYADIGPRVAKNGGYAAGGPYRIANQKLTSLCVYTNKPPAGAYRGFGVPQVCWAYESQMDDIARQLRLDPVAFRRRNLVREGDIFVTGDRLVSVGLEACLDQVANALGWRGLESTQPIPTASPDFVRGLGVAIMIKSTMTPSNSAASVRLNADGSATLLTSSVEIGQGSHTVLAQIVAATIGLPLDCVTVTFPDTDYTPYDQNTSSSRTTFSMGAAARQAALHIRNELIEIASDALEIPRADLEIVDGIIRGTSASSSGISIRDAFRARFGNTVGSIVGSFDHQTTGGLDQETGKGKASAYWFLSAAGAEVEVDRRTGKIRVVRAVTSADVGKAINPRQCWLQNEGSMLMALGSTLFEEMLFDNGQPLNSTLLDYMLPSIEDFPESFTSLLVENPHPDGPFGAKGIGESAMAPVAPAIGNAVANALGGVRFRDLPLTPERVVDAITRQETR